MNPAITKSFITIIDNSLYGAGGADFAGKVYYNLASPGFANNGPTSSGTWSDTASDCTISKRYSRNPYETSYMSGFQIRR